MDPKTRAARRERQGDGRRPHLGAPVAPQEFIHTNNCSNPIGMRVVGPSTAVRYSLDWGVSPAVVEAAFCMAIKLSEGGYAKST